MSGFGVVVAQSDAMAVRFEVMEIRFEVVAGGFDRGARRGRTGSGGRRGTAWRAAEEEEQEQRRTDEQSGLEAVAVDGDSERNGGSNDGASAAWAERARLDTFGREMRRGREKLQVGSR